VDALVVGGQSKAMMVNWLLMMLDQKSSEHSEERDNLWRKARSFDLCILILLSIFGKIDGTKGNS
jgi:hypothetical protein